jgi:hypothetical protein
MVILGYLLFGATGACEVANGWATRVRGLFGPTTIVVNGPAREPEDLLEAALELAQTQLLAQISDETSIDGRTMGVLAFLGALLAADVAAKDILGTWWWTPLVGIGLATLPCVWSILTGDTDLGPRSFEFYANYGAHPSGLARKQLLTDLDEAFLANAGRVKTKRRCLRWALAIISVGLITASLMITLDTPTTITNHGQKGKNSKGGKQVGSHRKGGHPSTPAPARPGGHAGTITGPPPGP